MSLAILLLALTNKTMSGKITDSNQRIRLANGERYQLAIEVIRCSSELLTKSEIERRAGIDPFNAERWFRFQELYQSEIVLHPVTKKIHWIGN